MKYKFENEFHTLNHSVRSENTIFSKYMVLSNLNHFFRGEIDRFKPQPNRETHKNMAFDFHQLIFIIFLQL